MTDNSFVAFDKIPRLNRECVITEKIDGTNAQVFIWDELSQAARNSVGMDSLEATPVPVPSDIPFIWSDEGIHLAVGSRSRWITPDNDNYGFAKWAMANAHELIKLGHGRHYGEWWGQGIQRGYGMKEKRFSLFQCQSLA